MDYLNVVVGLLLAVVVVQECHGENQRFTIEPENQSATIGSKVQLPCRVVGKLGVLQWTKDDFGLGTDRNLSGYDRYSMVGDEGDGNFTLQIEALQLDDDARYQCQVSPGPEGQASIRSRFATLTVLVPPEPPVIAQGDFIQSTENKEIELHCESIGGKPAATLTWLDGSGNTISSGVKKTKEPLPDGKRVTAKSVLRLKPQRHHHNTTLTCQAKNTSDKSVKMAYIKIEVLYAPKVKITLESCTPPTHSNFNASIQVKRSHILEGSEAHFKCEADGNPTNIRYKWFINNELVIGDYTTEMAIYTVNRSHHDAVVKCEATNDIGIGEAHTTLNVHYAPFFKESPKSVEADKNDKVTLKCEADGNPLEIVWVHDPIDRLNYQPRVLGTKQKLKITVSNETAGRYFCKAIVVGFPEIKAAADVFMKQAPQITSPPQQFGVIGDTLHLECSAISIPKARHISWSFKGREIQMNGDHDFAILEEPTLQGIKSTLIIRNSQAWHFDKYNCSVVNDYGTDVLQIDLMHTETVLRQIRNNLPIFVTISIMTALILIVIVCFVYIKTMGRRARQTKKEKNFPHHDNYMMNYSDETSSTEKCCKDSDRSSPSSDYKIKQSSSESNYSLPSTVSDTTLMQIISNNVSGIPYEKPIAYRRSVNYGDDDAYYTSKDIPNSYGSITAIKNRRSMDYDDDRYYIANNIRNSQYAMNPNASPNYVQKPLSSIAPMTTAATTLNYPSAANRYVSHPKHATLPIASPATAIDPRQDVGLPRSSIV